MARPLAHAFLNDVFVPLTEARISPLDRGFLFGDGVYEVIPVYGGCAFRLQQHLERLDYSLAEIRLANPYTAERWTDVLQTLIARNGSGSMALYVEITRGTDTSRDHGFPQGVRPTVFAMAAELPTLPESVLTRGVAAITREDLRWRRCDIKAVSLLGNVLLRQEAVDAGAAETILLRDGFAVEGAASSLFVWANGRVITPPKGPDLLPGITRDLVLELARAADLRCAEIKIPGESLRDADEIWITSSTREVAAVTALDGRPVGDGRPGPNWRRIYDLLQAYKKDLAASGRETV